MATIHFELCRSNSDEVTHREPTIVEWFSVDSEEEACEVLARPMLNGFYCRRVD